MTAVPITKCVEIPEDDSLSHSFLKMTHVFPLNFSERRSFMKFAQNVADDSFVDISAKGPVRYKQIHNKR
ncbi:unnamed protein product [Clavelina lepadiformis]|uniref:Uncharacterized protein n=1 Tax=Clavelina lepadiformis TaxID=159417 RepID=A0ABP0G967_CLALP